jgi:uroporphyrinogen decarboxylase
VPLIYYDNQCSALMHEVASHEVDFVGVDWLSPLSIVRAALGPDKAVQGNLDPAALFAPARELERAIDAVLDSVGPESGHIFNLGHGIWPETDPGAVARLIDYVHERTSRDVRP